MDTFEPTNEAPGEAPTVPVPEIPTLPTTPEDQGAPGAEQVHLRQFVFDLFETLMLAVLLYLGINAVSARVRVDGFSMKPTLQDGEYVLVSKMSYRLGAPQRGDIIVFRYPFQPPQDLIKRIIGLPGDKVVIGGAKVIVNGQTLVEPYIAAAPTYRGQWQVPDGFLFVLGDNRNDSSDSHSWGLLPIENVIGKAILIYWPPTDWDLINHFNSTATAPQPMVTP